MEVSEKLPGQVLGEGGGTRSGAVSWKGDTDPVESDPDQSVAPAQGTCLLRGNGSGGQAENEGSEPVCNVIISKH